MIWGRDSLGDGFWVGWWRDGERVCVYRGGEGGVYHGVFVCVYIGGAGSVCVYIGGGGSVCVTSHCSQSLCQFFFVHYTTL